MTDPHQAAQTAQKDQEQAAIAALLAKAGCSMAEREVVKRETAPDGTEYLTYADGSLGFVEPGMAAWNARHQDDGTVLQLRLENTVIGDGLPGWSMEDEWAETLMEFAAMLKARKVNDRQLHQVLTGERGSRLTLTVLVRVAGEETLAGLGPHRQSLEPLR